MADDYSKPMLQGAVKIIEGILLGMLDNNSHGEINIVVVDGEVKFINETYKNKY